MNLAELQYSSVAVAIEEARQGLLYNLKCFLALMTASSEL